MVILSDHGIRKISFENFDFSAALGENLQVVYQSLERQLPHPAPCA